LHSGKGLLVIRSGAQSGNRYVVDGLTTIGRHPDSAICLDDVTVSRRHAQVALDNGRYVVRDLGSLNGTYVNQMRIDELALEQGDELQIGKYRMVFFNG
jgi:pSer/pThr/pTyr-binding forkhead associated (FHA) protein